MDAEKVYFKYNFSIVKTGKPKIRKKMGKVNENRKDKNRLELEFLSHFLKDFSFVSSDEKSIFMSDKLFFFQHFKVFLGNIKI